MLHNKNYNASFVYRRILAVINSCKTKKQLDIARKYAHMLLSNYFNIYQYSMEKNRIIILKWEKFVDILVSMKGSTIK